jgi:predicted HicB family RNase H-like nuclease
VPLPLHDAVTREAKAEGKTVNDFVADVLKQAVADRGTART